MQILSQVRKRQLCVLDKMKKFSLWVAKFLVFLEGKLELLELFGSCSLLLLNASKEKSESKCCHVQKQLACTATFKCRFLKATVVSSSVKLFFMDWILFKLY